MSVVNPGPAPMPVHWSSLGLSIIVAEQGPSWKAQIVARRLISWLSHTPLLLRDADPAFYQRFNDSFTKQMRFLTGTFVNTPDGHPRLATLIALVLIGLCVADQKTLVDTYQTPLTNELDRQILPDGGHISRDPSILPKILLDLLPLKQCFVARDQVPPSALLDAISRMLPMLRFFRLGDGMLARFNGAGVTQTDSVATLLSYHDLNTPPPVHAINSGYCRLESGPSVVITDVGETPPLAVSSQAHAGCLSFEMSVGRHPLIVNCGTPPHLDEKSLLFARQTEAHSTICLGEQSYGSFLRSRFFHAETAQAHFTGLDHVVAMLSQESGDSVIRAYHDGYHTALGARAERQLRLREDGLSLDGTDWIRTALVGNKATAFAIRFHLHPEIEVGIDENSPDRVDLTLPGGIRWIFKQDGAKLEITDSVYMAYQHGARDTQQLVLTGMAREDTEVKWALYQHDTLV